MLPFELMPLSWKIGYIVRVIASWGGGLTVAYLLTNKANWELWFSLPFGALTYFAIKYTIAGIQGWWLLRTKAEEDTDI